MKGTPQIPQCGFSATVAEILKRCGVDDYLAVNVLEDAEIRQGIKEYANWPTIPQLYVNGEFVGGCDILREMYQAASCKQLLEAARLRPDAPPRASRSEARTRSRLVQAARAPTVCAASSPLPLRHARRIAREAQWNR